MYYSCDKLVKMEVSTTNAEKDEVKRRFGSVFSTIKKLGFFYNDVAGTLLQYPFWISFNSLMLL